MVIVTWFVCHTVAFTLFLMCCFYHPLALCFTMFSYRCDNSLFVCDGHHTVVCETWQKSTSLVWNKVQKCIWAHEVDWTVQSVDLWPCGQLATSKRKSMCYEFMTLCSDFVPVCVCVSLVRRRSICLNVRCPLVCAKCRFDADYFYSRAYRAQLRMFQIASGQLMNPLNIYMAIP